MYIRKLRYFSAFWSWMTFQLATWIGNSWLYQLPRSDRHTSRFPPKMGFYLCMQHAVDDIRCVCLCMKWEAQSNLWEACTATCIHDDSNICLDWKSRLNRTISTKFFHFWKRGNSPIIHILVNTGTTRSFFIIKVYDIANSFQAWTYGSQLLQLLRFTNQGWHLSLSNIRDKKLYSISKPLWPTLFWKNRHSRQI